MPRTISSLKSTLQSWFLDHLNQQLLTLSLPCLDQQTSFIRMRYVCEHAGCSTLAKYRLCNAGLGNRAPRPGRQRSTRCGLCLLPLNELHVAFLCPYMNDFRQSSTDIMVFLSICRTRRIYPSVAYRMYLRGLDWAGNSVPTSVYLNRGLTLQRLTNEWLRRS